jgi:2-(1,2-epoxy-1,2-dihydrophenyl)acetyl-CoA isomerase
MVSAFLLYSQVTTLTGLPPKGVNSIDHNRREGKMKERKVHENKDDYFSVKTIKDVAILSFKEDFLIRIPDLSIRDNIINCLSNLSENDSIKVIVLAGSPDKIGKDEYFRFYRQASKSAIGYEYIQRMYNVVDQIVLAIMGARQIVINSNSGKVISIFLNMSLACDYRIVADNTIFQNPYIDLGTIPKGGGVFFISRKVNSGKAYEILLSEKDITAQDALKLGIVDRVVPLEKLEESAIKVAHWFSRKPARTLEGVKKLLNRSKEGIIESLEIENQEIDKIISNSSFWKCLANIHVLDDFH